MIAALLLAAAPPAGQVPISTRDLVPPTRIAAPNQPPVRLSLAWEPGPVRCDGMAIAAARVQKPASGLVWPGRYEGGRTVTYRFRLDTAGRPLSITVAGSGTGDAVHVEDLAPSLAASRLPAGPARSDCAVTYTMRITPLPDAPVADLMAHTVTPTAGTLPRAGWDRIVPPGSNCLAAPRPRVLLRAYPDFLALPTTPGVGNWAMVGYDLDARGRPRRPHIVGGTHHAPLDAAAVKAVAASRFTRGARTGCIYPYRQAAGILPAPPVPGRVGGVATAARCPAGDAWAYRPAPTYPEPWRRRAIEGWAVIGFDVAPWGDIGNVHVVASEPAAAFGQEALRLLRGARKQASATGQVGCIERVRFAIPARAAADPATTDD